MHAPPFGLGQVFGHLDLRWDPHLGPGQALILSRNCERFFLSGLEQSSLLSTFSSGRRPECVKNLGGATPQAIHSDQYRVFLRSVHPSNLGSVHVHCDHSEGSMVRPSKFPQRSTFLSRFKKEYPIPDSEVWRPRFPVVVVLLLLLCLSDALSSLLPGVCHVTGYSLRSKTRRAFFRRIVQCSTQ